MYTFFLEGSCTGLMLRMVIVFTMNAKIGFFGEYIYLCQDINLCEVKRIGIFLLAVLLLSIAGCRKYEQIRILSGEVESLKMNGLRSADVILKVEVANPAGRIVLEDVKGTLKYFGKVLGKVSLAPFELRPRSTEEYLVEVRVSLDRGVGLMELMNMMNADRLMECKVDISAKGKSAGVKIKREYKDIPLKKLLEDHNDEKI